MKTRNPYRSRLCIVLLVFFAAAFLLPAVQTGDTRLYILAAAVPCGIVLFLLLPAGFFSLDRPSVAAALILCALGILAPASVLPDESVSQAIRTVVALFFLTSGVVLVRSCRVSFASALLTAALSLILLSFPLLLSVVSFSLTEVGMVLLMFSVAVFLALRQRLSALISALSGLFLMLYQHDLCASAIWCISCVLLFWTASGSGLWSCISLVSSAALVAGFMFLVRPFTVAAQEDMLLRIAGMSFFMPESAPKAESLSADSLFFMLGEQYGLVFLLSAVLLLCILILCGASVALHTRKAFHASLALGTILVLGLRMLYFLLSLTGMIPVPIGSFPLLTDSLPQLCGEFFLIGLLSGVSARNGADLDEDSRLAMLAR